MMRELLIPGPVELARREILAMSAGLPTDSPFHAVDLWLLGDPDTLQPAIDVLLEGVGMQWDGAWRERFLAVEAIRVAHLSAEERATAAAALASAVLRTDSSGARDAAARLGHAGVQTFVASVVGTVVFLVTGTIYGIISILGDQLPTFFLWKAAMIVLYIASALAAAGIVAAFPATLIADARRNARWRQLAAIAMGCLGGPDSVSALARLVAEDAENRNPVLWKAYGSALPTLRDSDYGRLRLGATDDMCASLRLTQMETTDDQMAIGILDALEAAGDGAGAGPLKEFAEDMSVAEETTCAAYRTLRVLEERLHAERLANRLLRSAERPDESGLLVRPAQSASMQTSALPRIPTSDEEPDSQHISILRGEST